MNIGFFGIGIGITIVIYLHFSKINVNVYIIDSPIDINHRNFGSRAKIAKDQGFKCVDHGTHVAGIVDSISKNVILHSIGILDCDNKASVDDLIDSINWVIHNHQKPAIINLSLVIEDSLVFKDLDAVIEKAIESGIIVVASAGNGGVNRCNYSPATANEIILVGSISKNGLRSSFSNYGDCVTVYTSGEMIVSTIGNNMYTEMSGTSQSTPRITGLIAELLLKNEKLSQKEVKRYLENISINKNILI